MWHRTKRLINSYLDDLIQRASGPDREAREITRAELARLSELEVQTRASAKVLEKELAEVNLKLLGVAEREKIARERGDEHSASAAGRQLLSLEAERNLIVQQLGEAGSAADRARALREERRRVGQDLATETHLTAMRENLSSVQTPFSATDPSATIDEMRERIKRSGGAPIDNRVAQAERDLEAERARAQVEEMLLRYKNATTEPQSAPQTTASQDTQTSQTQSGASAPDAEAGGQSKTLGRTDGPVRPID